MLFFTLASCTTAHVQVEPGYHRHQQSFYYYPSANVYFDGSCNRYIYNNGGSWISASILPRGVYIENSPRYSVSYNGPEIWRDNDLHRKRYHEQREERREHDRRRNRDRD